MNIEELEKLVVNGESEVLEFKKSTGQLIPAGKTICGFLNHKGGLLLLGVLDNQKIIGQEVVGKTKENITNNLLIKLSPDHNDINVEYVKLKGDNKYVIIIKAIANEEKTPYMFDGKAYIRVQNTTQEMVQEQYNLILSRRLKVDRTWDSDHAEDYNIDDLDHKEIEQCVKDGVEAGRLPESLAEENVENILKGLQLLSNGKLKNAAVALFAKEMKSSFLHCGVKLALFNGTDKLSGFIDERQCQGNIFTLLLAAEDFIRRNMKIGIEYDNNSFYRIDKPQFPMLAVRELLVNAFCHRSYLMRGASVMVAIFSDRIEIWNPGALVSEITISELTKRQHVSVTRNQTIAKVLYNRKLIEAWGTGISRVLDICNEAGNRSPVFTENSGGLAVEVPSLGVNVNISHKIKITPESNRRNKVIELLKSHPEGLSKKNILEVLGDDFGSEGTLKRDLALLKSKGKIYSKGSGRSLKWLYTMERGNS